MKRSQLGHMAIIIPTWVFLAVAAGELLAGWLAVWLFRTAKASGSFWPAAGCVLLTTIMLIVLVLALILFDIRSTR